MTDSYIPFIIQLSPPILGKHKAIVNNSEVIKKEYFIFIFNFNLKIKYPTKKDKKV